MIGFGEFLENNHTLVPSPYCEEWWVKEVMHAMDAAGLDRGGLAAKLNVPLATVDEWLDDFFYSKPGPAHAFLLSRELGVPLHPRHVHFWNALAPDQVKDLRDALKEGWTAPGAGRQQANLSCKNDPRIKQILELACIPHEVDKDVLHFNEESFALVETLALDKDIPGELPAGSSTVEVLTALSGTTIRDKAPHFMGMRMGRPEKAKERKMSPPVHGLFPLGHAAGNQRVLQDAMKKPVDVEIANRACPSCRQATFLPWCPKCKGRTVEYRTCPKCGETLRGHDDTCKKCNVPGQFFSPRKLNLVSTFMDAVNRLNMNIPKFKGVKGMSSVSKLPEMLEKGMLRAKNDVFVYKDGTARFDTGDCPLTHFTPKEISVGVHDLVNLGYTTDINGEPLEHPDQVLELKYQDILLPKASLKYFLQVSRFVDELLEKVYGLPRFYNIKNPKDFIGQLVIGLAPHTSAGVVGRIIGFTHANVGYAHPIYHAAKRRNCDGDEDGILLFLDVILNFSRYYLPSSIGSRMDTPLVISSRVVPEEVDGEAHNVDAGWEYPLEFYETTQQYPDPKDVKKLVHTVKDRLDTEGQYEGLGFTHPTSSINDGPKTTAYKELGSMADKIAAQFELAKKIAAVDAADQAARVIQSHFTPDIMGNLRAFTSQEFRCTKCNEKYRRPPLSGKCTKCGHEGLALTVSPASIKKYLEQALSLVREYALSAYTRQKIEMLAEKVEATVFNGTKKQLSLSEFF